MRAEDRARLRHMVEAAESAVHFMAGRQRPNLDEDVCYCLSWSARVGSAEQRAYSTMRRSDLWL
jgi:hypothetical protein